MRGPAALHLYRYYRADDLLFGLCLALPLYHG